MLKEKDGHAQRVSGMRRREFLVLSSIGAVGVATTGLASELGRSAGLIAGAPRPYAVGYSAIVPSQASDAPVIQQVVPVQSLRSGDGEFGGKQARVTVHGFWRAADARNERVSVALGAFYPTADGTAPMLAWSHAARRTSSLNVPVSPDGELTLDFQMRDPLPAPQLYGVSRRFADLIAGARSENDTLLHAPVETRCRLSTGFATGAPKLRAGTYVVAFRRSFLEPAPAWSSLRLVGQSGRIAREESPLQHATVTGLRPADDVDYLLLSVDHVKA